MTVESVPLVAVAVTGLAGYGLWVRFRRPLRAWADRNLVKLLAVPVSAVAVLGVSSVSVTAGIVLAAVILFAIAWIMLDAFGVRLFRRRRASVWPTVHDAYGREVYAYAFGSMDKRTKQVTHVKFGWSAQDHGKREWQIEHEEGQVPRTHTVVALARGAGGEPREKYFHRLLHVHRYERSEWFGIHPDVVAAVAELERLTEDGRRFLKEYR